MSTLTAPVRVTVRRFGETSRRDSWWIQPLLVFLGLSTFLVYATWAAFQGDHYTFGPYLSPFYSPEVFGASAHSWFGPKPAWWPGLLPFSPALLILPFPGLFRFTCYYYRGAYYKAFWADPPSCTVGEPRSSYWGENSFPLILQNVHRYMLFLSVFVLIILAVDVWKALWWSDPATPGEFVFHLNEFTTYLGELCGHYLRNFGGWGDRVTGEKRAAGIEGALGGRFVTLHKSNFLCHFHYLLLNY